MVLVQPLTPAQQLVPSQLKSVEGVRKTGVAPTENPRVFFDIAADGNPLGRVVIELDEQHASMTCANFLALCTGSHKSTDKRLHYESTIFHRIVTGMYVCGGDVINDNGTSGMSIYGPKFDDESTSLKHDAAGTLSMLSHGPNTNNSQFFITLEATPWMDGFYVPFGKVVNGLEMLIKMSKDYGSESGIPKVNNVRIVECGQL